VRYWTLAGLAACYSPSIQTGAPCPNDVCPRGLVCSPATMTCETVAVDAAVAVIDTPMGLPDGCYGGGMLALCPDDPIQGNTSLVVSTPLTLSTTTSSLCEPYHLVNGAPDTTYCVVASRMIAITSGAKVIVTGTRPLVVIAKDAMTIDGTLDAASHAGATTGPNANASACIAGGAPTLDDGGPGGSFGTAGGAGGGTDGSAPVPAAAASPKPATLRGGCPGRTGSGVNNGDGGAGGGAIYLIATTLTITGTINASGAGGQGAGLSAGGGGGGSGGMIGLDAATIVAGTNARIFANGGGGGEGGGGSNGGNDGGDPVIPTLAAPGGGGNAGAGGDAGDGSIGAGAGKAGLPDTDSGGGGGGGAGVIRVFPSQPLGGSISPPPST
jgi:hypothetical protein